MPQIQEVTPVIIGSFSTIIFALFIWWIDIWEREPLDEVFKRLLWGAGPAIIIASFAYSLIYPLFPDSDVFRATKIAPFVEEFSKGFGVFLVMSTNSKDFDSPLDGIIYGSLIGFGFSISENIMYYADFHGSQSDLITLVKTRSFIFGFGHAFLTAFVGLGFGLFRVSRHWSKFLFPFFGYLIAVGFHALHNYLVSQTYVNSDEKAIISEFIGVLGILIFIVFLLLEEKRIIRKYLADETQRDILTPKNISQASSLQLRLWTDIRLVLFGDKLWKNRYRFLQLCAKLAHKKFRFEKLGYHEVGMHELSNIRSELSKLSYVMDYY